MSRIVLTQSDQPRFSHVGVVLLFEGVAFVAHAMPREAHSRGGVVVEPLADFASETQAASLAIFRASGFSNDDRRVIRAYILGQVGKPFDDEFRMSESDKFYCAELALKAVGVIMTHIVDALPRLRVMLLSEPVVPPDHLLDLPNLELVYQPDFDASVARAR